MARRPRVFARSLLYRIMVRGNQRQKTFRSDHDYKAYLDRLEKYRAQVRVRVYAYCLMPNHVHLLLETGSTPLAKFMQGLQQSHTQYFNRRHRKVAGAVTESDVTIWTIFSTRSFLVAEITIDPSYSELV